MNLLLCAVSHAEGISGVQRHALNLVRSFESQSWMGELHIVLGPWQQTMRKMIEQSKGQRTHVHLARCGRGSVSRNAWHYMGLPVLASELGVDVVHLTYPVPVDRGALPCASVVSLHDLYCFEIPQNFGWPKAVVNRWILRECLSAANAIVCVSESTASALTHYMGRRVMLKSRCIYNCVEAGVDAGAEAVKECAKPFLLCVAQHRKNKNLSFLLEVFRQLQANAQFDERMQLVVVGIAGPETRRIERDISRFGLAGKVRLLEGLSDAQLRWCYRECAAVVAPSLIEGFGLPVVEGMLEGARVICSDIPAFREFGTNTCRFVSLRLAPLEGIRAEERFGDAIVGALREPKPDRMAFAHLSSGVVGDTYGELYREVLTEYQRGAIATNLREVSKPAEEQWL